MTDWPRDSNKLVNFSNIVDPLVESARHLLKVEWNGEDVPYTGYPLGLSAQAISFNPDEKLKAERLIYDEEQQGRDPLEVMIGIAVSVGIEQGRRIDREQNDARTLYEVDEAIEAACRAQGLDDLTEVRLRADVRERLRRSQDLLTRIHFKRVDNANSM